MSKFCKSCLAMSIYTLSLSSFSLGNVHIDPLSEESQRLKHQADLEESEKALEKADKFLSKSKQSVELQLGDTEIDENQPIIKKISVDLLGFPAKLDLYKVVESYQGRNITAKQIFEISRVITNTLYQAGYVTSAVGLKSKDLSDGHLQFIVYWGEVDHYLVNKQQPESFKEKAMLKWLPEFQQNIFNIHHIDQFIEMMTTSNKSVSIDVLPSEKEGKSDLNFVVKREKYPKFQFGFNNSGAENNANGRNQATLAVRMGDLIGLNDEWYFSMGYRFYRNHKKNNQINYSIGYTQPFSFYTLDTKLSQSNYEKLLKGQNGNYTSNGKNNTLNIKLSRMVHRNQDSILSIFSELEFKKKTNFVADKKVLSRTENKFGLGLSYITNLFKGKLYSELNYINGLNWSGADPLAYTKKGNKTLKLVSGNITWNRAIAIKDRFANYQLRIGAQYSPYRLYSDNQFSLGDEYTVRGFKGGIISGESGSYLAQTFSFPFYPQKYGIKQISPFIGLDIGQVYQKENSQKETISGFVLGIKSTLFNHLSISFSYAKPLKNIKHNKNKSIYYFNGSVSF